VDTGISNQLFWAQAAVLSIFGVRTMIVKLLPRGGQVAMGAGIGIFLCFIGMQSAQGIGIVKDHPETLVTLNTPLTVGSNYDAYKMWLSVAVLIFTCVLFAINVPGAPLCGIVFGTLVAWSECWATQDNSVFNYPFHACSIGMNATAFQDAGCYCYAPERVAAAGKIQNTAGVFQWNALKTDVFWVSVFTFLYTDILDSSGTFFAVAKRAGYVDKYGNLPRGNANMAYLSDAVGTIIGSCLGTSTITTFVESSAGVIDGGRTGLTAITVGTWFAFAIPFAPLLGKIPPLASGPILCIVGALMMKNIQGFDWGDIEEALPAFCVLVMIPLTYSISYGIIGGTFLWLIIQTLLIPYRMILKQDPFIKFKMLLGPVEETTKEFDNASIANQAGVDPKVEYTHVMGKPEEQLEMQSLRSQEVQHQVSYQFQSAPYTIHNSRSQHAKTTS